MKSKDTPHKDHRSENTRHNIRKAFLTLLKKKTFSQISVTEICRHAEINRGTFYTHYYDMEDLFDDIFERVFSDVSGTIDHVLCPHQDTCSYPFCQKLQENRELWPLFLDDTLSERIVSRLSEQGKESFVNYLMAHSDLSYAQAESIFIFQINGCLSINRLMLKNNGKDWHEIQETADRFIRAGVQAFLTDAKS